MMSNIKQEIFDKEFYFIRDFFHYKTTPSRLKHMIFNTMENYAEAKAAADLTRAQGVIGELRASLKAITVSENTIKCRRIANEALNHSATITSTEI